MQIVLRPKIKCMREKMNCERGEIRITVEKTGQKELRRKIKG